jgi:hypothetical protein
MLPDDWNWIPESPLLDDKMKPKKTQAAEQQPEPIQAGQTLPFWNAQAQNAFYRSVHPGQLYHRLTSPYVLPMPQLYCCFDLLMPLSSPLHHYRLACRNRHASFPLVQLKLTD